MLGLSTPRFGAAWTIRKGPSTLASPDAWAFCDAWATSVLDFLMAHPKP
jgi:hypothetical protein